MAMLCSGKFIVPMANYCKIRAFVVGLCNHNKIKPREAGLYQAIPTWALVAGKP